MIGVGIIIASLIVLVIIEIFILYIGIRYLYEMFRKDIYEIEDRILRVEKRIAKLEKIKKEK